MVSSHFGKTWFSLLILILLPVVSIAQTYQVSGRVVDENANPIPGVNIRWAQTTSGTTTDVNGSFRITWNGGAEGRLAFSALGYKRQERVLQKNTTGDIGTIVMVVEILDLKNLIITATRNERSLEAIPLPVSVVDDKVIRNSGSNRLSDILSEQTGMTLVSELGTGLQMQGFDPDYTLILIDGEPIIGRTGGTLDLTRIALGNVKQIEIVKGPSSSLYGSEALAGVINIITQKPSDEWMGIFSASTGSNRLLDLGADTRYRYGNVGISIFANHYRNDGYDLDTNTRLATIPTYWNSTLSGRIRWDIRDNMHFTTGFRGFDEQQRNQDRFITLDRGLTEVNYFAHQYDWSFTPEFEVSLVNGPRLIVRQNISLFNTRTYYRYDSDDVAFDFSDFDQRYSKTEIQADQTIGSKHLITTGLGIISESVEADRFNDRLNKLDTRFVFAQHEWNPTTALNVISGFRYDDPSAYDYRLSPRLAISYALGKGYLLRASAGTGFKAPDFRQLYLNFFNPAGGYTVVGSAEAEAEVLRLIANGSIQPENLFLDPSTVSDIRPENSRSINIGAELKRSRYDISVNAFRNDVSDLIETSRVAMLNDGQTIFSYQNLDRVLTKGIEFNTTIRMIDRLSISAGYQYLDTRDQAVYDEIRDGRVFRRDPVTGNVSRVKTYEYGGLYNRSRHSGSLRMMYDNTDLRFSAALRGVFRGRFGFGDINGNGIVDVDGEYANAYTLWNVTLSKHIRNGIEVQTTVNNILGYTDSRSLPIVPGRLFQVSLRLDLANMRDK